jgi:cold shock CspA family protein
MTRKTILINEDEVPFAQALAGAFRKEGFEVEVTHLVRDAEKVLSEKKVDLVITDLELPECRGETLIETVFEGSGPAPAVIAMSGVSGFGNPIYPFFSKPFRGSELIGFVKNHLGTLADVQLIQGLALKTGLPVRELGKVVHFDPVKGWGLLRVIGQDRAVYVNAADVVPSPKVSAMSDASTELSGGPPKPRRFQFVQLFPGQVVHFQLNADSARGPRASGVRVVFTPKMSRES